MTGRAYANLNEYHSLYPCKDFLFEKFSYVVGGNGKEGVVHRYAYALLTPANAECAAKLYLFSERILGNQILKLLHYLTRALDVAGASDTNGYLKHNKYLSIKFDHLVLWSFEIELIYPGDKRVTILLASLYRLRCGDDRQPFLYGFLFNVALAAEKLKIFFCAVRVAIELE